MISKVRLFTFLVYLLWQFTPLQLLSQPAEYIHGKIIIQSTAVPVPFTAIKLKAHQLGVFANAEGDFKIIYNPGFQSDSLIITSIGYKRKSVSFKDLSLDKINMIYLAPAVYGLGEVKVIARKRSLGSVAIIGKAIRNIKNNYPDKPYNFISYYRDYQKKDSDYINLNEAIIQTLDAGFSSKSESDNYRMLDFRKNTDFPRINISPYYDSYEIPYSANKNKSIPRAELGDQLGNELFILITHDAIRNFETKSFSYVNTLSEDFLFNHDFSDPVQIYNNNLLLYKISFTAKSRLTFNAVQATGAIYIQPKDFSIHKLEYSCSYQPKRKRGLEVPEKKEIYNIIIEYGYENAVSSLMCLKYISFNNIFNSVDSTDNTYFRILKSYWESSLPYKSAETFEFPNLNMIFEFSNKIDPQSASRRENYLILIGKRTAKIRNILVDGKTLTLRIKDEDFRGSLDSCNVSIHDLKDINGNILNKRKTIELVQYRELFVQEYNKSISFKDSCYLDYLPLDQNCISRYSGKDKYWMNTPENIKTKIVPLPDLK